MICSHAVFHDGRTICITVTDFAAGLCSTTAGGGTGTGTFLFDTVNREWSRAPYGSDLPFSGGAHYVPGLNLWLGLVAESHCLCATDDLSAALHEERPPMLRHQWEDAVEAPEEWRLKRARLIDLGEGRFCIFKIIHDLPYKDADDDDHFYLGSNLGRLLALLTGVEVKRPSSPDAKAELRMVTHKSLSFVLKQEDIIWVL